MYDALKIVGDDSILTRQATEIAKLLGYLDIQCVDELKPDAPNVFIAVEDTAARVELTASINADRLVNLIHPTAFISPGAKLAKNILVGAQAIIGSNARVGTGVVQNALSSIEHDNQIGAFTFLGTGAILCGNVTTGECVFVGGGATIKPGVTIGAHTTIGTGSVLVKDADENKIYIGNPAKPLSR